MQSTHINHLRLLNKIGIALTAEKNIDHLLELILLGAKELTNADGGTIYLVHDQYLEMKIVRTDSLNIAMGGNSEKQADSLTVPLYDKNGNKLKNTVVGNAYHLDKTVNIKNAYDNAEYDFSGTYKVDQLNNYKSISFLTVPMKNHEGNIIGILQLINSINPNNGEITDFDEEQQTLAESLSSQAAIALSNKHLISEMHELFESIVRMMARTIDEKSQHTGNHCKRVPTLTQMIAKAINNTDSAYFKNEKFDSKKLYELEIASWLHDCGKLTTPDHIMEKSTKLEGHYDKIEQIWLKFELFKTQNPDFDKNKADEDFKFLQFLNLGSEFVSDEHLQKLEDIKNKYNIILAGEHFPILTDDEFSHLSIRKGTLTESERNIINDHIIVTIEMLNSLKFPKHLQNVPEYAGGHHERVDGKGFPMGLKRENMSVATRVMAIADIFEALTSTDRPYKEPLKLSEALVIMDKMSKTGHLDPDIYEIFVENKVYMEYADAFLSPSQIDVAVK